MGGTQTRPGPIRNANSRGSRQRESSQEESTTTEDSEYDSVNLDDVFGLPGLRLPQLASRVYLSQLESTHVPCVALCAGRRRPSRKSVTRRKRSASLPSNKRCVGTSTAARSPMACVDAGTNAELDTDNSYMQLMGPDFGDSRTIASGTVDSQTWSHEDVLVLEDYPLTKYETSCVIGHSRPRDRLTSHHTLSRLEQRLQTPVTLLLCSQSADNCGGRNMREGDSGSDNSERPVPCRKYQPVDADTRTQQEQVDAASEKQLDNESVQAQSEAIETALVSCARGRDDKTFVVCDAKPFGVTRFAAEAEQFEVVANCRSLSSGVNSEAASISSTTTKHDEDTIVDGEVSKPLTLRADAAAEADGVETDDAPCEACDSYGAGMLQLRQQERQMQSSVSPSALSSPDLTCLTPLYCSVTSLPVLLYDSNESSTHTSLTDSSDDGVGTMSPAQPGDDSLEFQSCAGSRPECLGRSGNASDSCELIKCQHVIPKDRLAGVGQSSSSALHSQRLTELYQYVSDFDVTSSDTSQVAENLSSILFSRSLFPVTHSVLVNESAQVIRAQSTPKKEADTSASAEASVSRSAEAMDVSSAATDASHDSHQSSYNTEYSDPSADLYISRDVTTSITSGLLAGEAQYCCPTCDCGASAYSAKTTDYHKLYGLSGLPGFKLQNVACLKRQLPLRRIEERMRSFRNSLYSAGPGSLRTLAEV